MRHRFRDALEIYLSLSKAKLASLVVGTTVFGYLCAPTTVALTSLPASSMAIGSCYYIGKLAITATGTALCASSANTFNQVIELERDRQMKRTQRRMIVSGRISRKSASLVGLASGLAGTSLLCTAVNPITGCLGLGTILLYAGVYTPMKPHTEFNTHVGAIVGAIPPLMGWTAITGSLTPIGGGLTLAALLYLWQIPHFMALSYNLRDDYGRGQFAMTAVRNPDQCAPQALRYSIYLFSIAPLAHVTNLCEAGILVDGTALTAVALYSAWRFYKQPGRQSARQFFFVSLAYLPFMMMLIYINGPSPPRHQRQENSTEIKCPSNSRPSNTLIA